MSKEHGLDCELDHRFEEALITGHAGVPLVIELFSASGAAEVMDAQVQLKQLARGLSVSQMAEMSRLPLYFQHMQPAVVGAPLPRVSDALTQNCLTRG